MTKMRLDFDLDAAIRESAREYATGGVNTIDNIAAMSTNDDITFVGGRRVAATGAVFKRELKVTDSFQSISDLIVSPSFTDMYDGQATFFGPMETKATIATGEAPIGSTFCNTEYIIEAPVKRAPSFGAGDLLGIDLNVYHDNINYHKNTTLPDIEVYKFKGKLADNLTIGTFGAPSSAKGNIIVGSMSYKSGTTHLMEKFDGKSTFTGSLAKGNEKRGVSVSKSVEDGDPYLELDDAWNIQDGDLGHFLSRDRSAGGPAGSKGAFRKAHAKEFEGRYIVPLRKGYGHKLEVLHGRRYTRSDFSIDRRFYDYRYAYEIDQDTPGFISDLLRFKSENFANVEDTDFTAKVLNNSVINSTDTMFRGVRYTNYIQNGTKDDGSPKISAYSLPVFSDFNTPASGSCMHMACLYPTSQAHQKLTLGGKAEIDYQQIVSFMRVPKPLTLARVQNEDEPMDSMEVVIRFAIPRMDKYHREGLNTSDAFGHNLSRSFGVFFATRPMDGSEDLSAMLNRINTGPSVDFKNRAGVAEGRNLRTNSYNGLFFFRHTTDQNDSNAATGEIKIIQTGDTRGNYNVHGQLSSSKPNGPAFIVKDGGQGGGTITNSRIEPNILKTIGTDGDPNTLFECGEWYTLKAYINHRNTSNGYIRWVLLNDDGNIMFRTRQKHQGMASFNDATCDVTNNDATVTHDANANIVAGLSVSGTGIPEGAVVQSVTNSTTFELNVNATATNSNTTLTFGAADTNTGDHFPSHLHFVTSNCRVGSDGESVGSDHLYSAGLDSQVDVCIESVLFKGFEGDKRNASISANNHNPNAMIISSTSDYDVINDSDGTFTKGENIKGDDTQFNDLTKAIPTYLFWGAKTDIWSGATNNIFMGGFDVANHEQNDVGDAAKSPKLATTSGLDSAASDFLFFVPDNSSGNDLGMWLTQDRDQNLGIDHHLNPEVTLSGTNFCDNFTKPGFWSLNLNSIADLSDHVGGSYVARENPAFSTKITSIIDSNGGKVTVADPNVLKTFEDDLFIIYRAGRPYDNRFYRDNYVLADDTVFGGADGNTFTFQTRSGYHNGKADDGSTNLIHLENLPELYVSPLRYWLVAEIYNKAETSDTLLPDKTYQYSVVQQGTAPGSTTAGTTFSETLYSDTSDLSNKWSLTFSSTGGLVEDSVDYGFRKAGDEQGALDGEESLGYIQKYTPRAGYNTVSLDGLVSVENNRLNKPDEKVSLYIKASPEMKGVSALTTTKYTGTDRDPFFTFYYVDKLPKVDSFSISPNKDDPFFPDFKWSSSDDDLWYGFILLSDKEIKHQYNDAVAVLHLNETDVSATSNIKLKRFDGSFNGTEVESNAIGGTMATSTEGLAGNALLTDASEGCFVTFADNAYTQPTKEMSIVAHFTCSSVAHTGYIVGKANEFDIFVDTNGKVNATIHPATNGTPVVLQSTSVIPTDGETPTNVIVTFDLGLQSSNVKLFLNGKLEDQSGAKTTGGSANNWTEGRNLDNDTDSRLTVGIEPVDAGGTPNANGFSGKIEEIVIYNKVIHPVVPQTGVYTLTKPIEELTTSNIASGLTNVARLFIKDYHNIRGTSTTQVASSSNISYKKAGLGLKTN